MDEKGGSGGLLCTCLPLFISTVCKYNLIFFFKFKEFKPSPDQSGMSRKVMLSFIPKLIGNQQKYLSKRTAVSKNILRKVGGSVI